MLVAHLGHTWVLLAFYGGGRPFVLGHFLHLNLLADHVTLLDPLFGYKNFLDSLYKNNKRIPCKYIYIYIYVQ